MNKPPEENIYRIRAYRAIDDPEKCLEYVKGHVKVLADFGILNVTSANTKWIENPYMYCVVAERVSSGELVGGIRIQVADGLVPLPVETAIGHMDERIYEKVKYYAINGGVGELCGLWVSNELKGIGMAAYLVRAAIASSDQLHFQTMVGICAGYSLKMFQNVGFVIDYTLGRNGNFHYPNETYIAHVVGILNAITLDTADVNDKTIMSDLRKNGVQERMEETRGIVCRIFYNLKYQRISDINYTDLKNTDNDKPG